MSEPTDLRLAEALQRAFVEVGSPSLASVAGGAATSKQRLSDWRSGRHVPVRFEDVEPVLAYLRLLAGPQASSAAACDGGPVTAWSSDQWRHAWERSVAALAARGDEDAADSAALEAAERRFTAIVVMTLLVGLVVALAVTAFFLSLNTM